METRPSRGMVRRCPRPTSWTPSQSPDVPAATCVPVIDASSVDMPGSVTSGRGFPLAGSAGLEIERGRAWRGPAALARSRSPWRCRHHRGEPGAQPPFSSAPAITSRRVEGVHMQRRSGASAQRGRTMPAPTSGRDDQQRSERGDRCGQSRTASDDHQPASSRAIAELATTGLWRRRRRRPSGRAAAGWPAHPVPRGRWGGVLPAAQVCAGR